EERERRLEVRRPGRLLGEGGEVRGQPLDESQQAVVAGQVVVVLVLAVFAGLAGFGQAGAPRREAGDDPGSRRDAVPSRGADFGVFAEDRGPPDAGRGQELHYASPLEVGAYEVEEQRKAAGGGV